MCETSLVEEKGPNVRGGRRVSGVVWFFFKKAEHFKFHRQFANKYSSCISLRQYLAAHTVGLRGTAFNSMISTQLKTVLIFYFLKISFEC